jgi:amino acid adenylation domain-containing protein
MLGEAGVTAILAQSHLIDGLDDALALPAAFGAHALDLDALLATPMPPAALPIVVATDPAHVMYTSGSTGSPKGAVLPHRAIVRTVRGADYLHFGSDETFFAFVPLTFDVAILELWGPLLNGARLVLAPPGLPSLDVLAATIERGGVTTLWLTTALFEHMVDEQLPRLRGLRQLIVGGDVMSPAHARRALAALPGIRLLNVYGPTEATVLITAQPLTAPPVRPIPLGAPIANARVYVLDAMRNPVPIGVPGEIYTGGDGVARGYLNQPARTAEVFVTDPFDGRDGATMYRTGDLARWRADGTLDFLGRVDHQVKIRGIRVELGEIEAALTDHPDVREAVVIAAAAPDGEKQLIAYVVARIAAAPPDAGALLAYLTRRLPSQCIPAFIVMLDALPVTPTGKFDRKALPAPHPSVSAVRARRPAHTAAEIAVAAHMAEVLNLDDIGCDDDFYAFGGDSLRAMRLIARLRATFQVDLSIRDLLAAPRVGDLTAAIVALGRTTDGSARSNLTALRTSGASTPLFFLHGDLAGGGRYCDELARQLGEDRPVYVIAPHGVPAGTMPPSVKTMARDNVAAIRAIAPNGPVLLGGFCNGGVVAYEIATQLVRAGVAVEGVVLVDAVNVNPQPIPLHVRARRAARRALDRFRPEPPATSWDAWHDRWLDRWLRVLADYVPGPFRGPVALVWTDEFAPDAERFTAAWRRIAPAGSTGTMPGSHLTSLTRHLTTTARVLAEHIDRRPVQGDERVAHEDDLHARLPLPA